MSYYKIIHGIRYDRSLLDAADFHTTGRGEWQLSLEEIQHIFQIAGDGNIYTEIEWRTLLYIRQNYPFTAPALAWLDEQLQANNSAGDIENTIEQVIRNEFGLEGLQWQISAEEVQQQLNRPGNVLAFGDALKNGLNALLSGGINVLSLSAVVKRRTGNGEIEDEAFLMDTTRQLLNNGGILFLVPESVPQQELLAHDLPKDLNFDLFWHFGLYVPALSPVLFMSSVLRSSPDFYHSKGYISRRVPLDELIPQVIVQLAQFPGLQWDIPSESVQQQLAHTPDQNFGEALFGALFVGIFNGESSFSFRDFIGQEVWVDPDRDLEDYMREYIETGTIYLLSSENSTSFNIPEFLQPDLSHDWAFLLKMPLKTDAYFIITSSRAFGFDASWNDGYLPETLSLAQQTQKVLQQFHLESLTIILPEEEFEAQRLQFGPDYRSFSSLLRQAINTIYSDYITPNSVFNEVAKRFADDIQAEHFDDPMDYRAAIRFQIQSFLLSGSLEFLPIELPDNNPVDGEPIEVFWQFFGFIADLSSVGFWVIIPRYLDDGQLPYTYGFDV